MRIALLGLRCAGKSTVGLALAELAGLPFVDLDECTSPEEPAGALLARVGEAEFRRREEAALERVLADEEPFVLATGGGAVETPACRDLLARRARCVWLRTELDVLRARMASDPAPRPALTGGDPAEELDELDRRRSPHYAALAELVVDAGDGEPRAIAERILAGLER